jgi:HlyD family secretion protein
MIPKSRSFRFFVILGVLVLLGTAVGASVMLNGNGEQDDSSSQGDLESRTFALGYTDISATTGPGYFRGKPLNIEGVSVLMPGQSGRVTWVIKEGTEVEKGAVLLKVDNSQQLAQLQQARAALDSAKQVEIQADAGLIQGHRHYINQQKAAIEVARLTQELAETDLKKAESAFKKDLISENDLRMAHLKVLMAKQSVIAEQEKLETIKLAMPEAKLAEAKAKVLLAEGKLREAQVALDECEVRAPTDGTVLRVEVAVHELIGPAQGGQMKAPPLQFCPKGKLIVRAEILQEWASRIKVGQEVIITDDAGSSRQWKGKVYYTAGFMTKKRNVIMEPFMVNDVRTMECKIEVFPSEHTLLIGQQVRAIIKTQ